MESIVNSTRKQIISPFSAKNMPSLLNIAFVFLGGGLGSVARFLLSVMVVNRIGTAFPFATLGINVLGSFLIGVVVALSGERLSILTDHGRFFLAVGVCGGFTTFSTFSLESFTMLQSGRPLLALVYVFLSVSLCVIGTASGLGLTYWWWKRLGI
jgi:CrcB protein